MYQAEKILPPRTNVAIRRRPPKSTWLHFNLNCATATAMRRMGKRRRTERDGGRRRPAEERARACGDFLRLRPKSVVDKERLKESIGQVPYCSETKFNGLQMVSRVIRNRTPQYKDQEVGKIWEQNHFNQAANGPVRMAQVQKPLYLIQR